MVSAADDAAGAGRDSRDAGERFAARAGGYVASETHAAGPDLELLVRLAVEPRPRPRVLDVGTGGGHVALAMARAGGEVVATDLTSEMLRAARAHHESLGVGGIEYVQAAADALPFAGASFDVVTCRNATHHFPDVPAFLGEAARVLRPGGRLVLQDQALPDDDAAATAVQAFEALRDPSHASAFRAGRWAQMLADAGLRQSAAVWIDKRHSFAAWCGLQDCRPGTVAALEEAARGLPPEAARWLAPEWDPESKALVFFRNRHLVLAADKPDTAREAATGP